MEATQPAGRQTFECIHVELDVLLLAGYLEWW